ncbi:hypothetical protein BCR34DRAFT_36951 [Clohesyomyces aquaticus]|uniref:DUF7580 domain-containing protein n=1 Tax=Clohesyomyces aquaticus TaxID=1231657 RepID=A0A1Y1Z7R8_9PLEO|nr:hypothetical protein BCR34DRAFT_36951 [Clohesyomyces aquaticus]
MILQEERKERATASTAAYWLAMRDHAYRLFSALHSLWPQSCCVHKHNVNLRVDPPISDEFHESLAITRLCFSLEKEGSDPIGKNVTMHSSPALETNLSLQKKKARFDLPASSESGSSFKCPETRKIQNLCVVLAQRHHKPCLGYIHVQQWHYHAHQTRECPHSGNLIPLRAFSVGRNRAGIAPRERCLYSIMLASAVMQLFDTPWLATNWSLDDIFVDSKDIDGQLYVSKSFGEDSLASTRTRKINAFVKNQMIFALGVALLELSYGKDIMSFLEPEDLDDSNQRNALTVYFIADRLTKEIQRIEMPRFARAVSKCICPASDTYDFDLTNEGYRHRFYVDVVQPLQQEYETLFPSVSPYRAGV